MSRLVETYESLLLSNLSAVQSVESGLRNVTWLLPGRFADAEVASEGLYALLNLVAGYHDSLLARHISPAHALPPHPFAVASSVPKQPAASPSSPSSNSSTPSPSPFPTSFPNSSIPTPAPTQTSAAGPISSDEPRLSPILPCPSEHTRYTRYWTARSALYRRASRALATLGYVQLLIEMVVRRGRIGERARWRAVLCIETVKTVLRLLLLRLTGRPVLSPPVPQREFDPSSLPASVLQRTNAKSSPRTASPTPTATAPKAAFPARREAVLPLMPAGAPLRSHLYPLIGAMDAEYLPDPGTLVPPLEGTAAWSAEVLQSCLGLIHVLLLIRASRQPTSSNYHPASLPSLSRRLTPFLVPLALALLARRLRTPPGQSLLLAEHYAKQDKQLAMRTFLSGPIWIGWTRPKVLGLARAVERVPLVGLVGELVEGYLPLVDDYYYYTSP